MAVHRPAGPTGAHRGPSATTGVADPFRRVAVIHYTGMIAVDMEQFTVGVFKDVAWAQRGLAALRSLGLPAQALTILAKDAPDVVPLFEEHLGARGERLDVASLGPVLALGPLVAALQGKGRELEQKGVAGTMSRVGYQRHDGQIYDALVARGGILVAIQSEPRAADALAILLSYGGGNAAIGAWTGRL